MSVSGQRPRGPTLCAHGAATQPVSAGSEVQPVPPSRVAAWGVCSLMLSSVRAPDLHLLRFFAWFYSNCFFYHAIPISNIIQIRIACQVHDLQKLSSLS